mmetsp:Transcript_45412/g.96577  ORF Transcript_45412/g.96577 Transcript_45412/m.96577 type:complete len:101 (-) Transcript_45412:53-355(-)
MVPRRQKPQGGGRAVPRGQRPEEEAGWCNEDDNHDEAGLCHDDEDHHEEAGRNFEDDDHEETGRDHEDEDHEEEDAVRGHNHDGHKNEARQEHGDEEGMM